MLCKLEVRSVVRFVERWIAGTLDIHLHGGHTDPCIIEHDETGMSSSTCAANDSLGL